MGDQASKILTKLDASCRQTGHLGEESRFTAAAQGKQQTRWPQGMNAHRRRLVRQITQSAPSGTSPDSSSSSSSSPPRSSSPSIELASRWSRLLLLHSLNLLQFLHPQKKKGGEGETTISLLAGLVSATLRLRGLGGVGGWGLDFPRKERCLVSLRG